MSVFNKAITFEKSLKTFVLDIFDKDVDAEGFIVEKEDPKQKVLTRDGEEIKKREFAGVRKGSEIFFKSDISSLIRLCDDLSR